MDVIRITTAAYSNALGDPNLSDSPTEYNISSERSL